MIDIDTKSATPSDEVMTRYGGKMMTRGEANKLRAADPDAIQISPVGAPAVVKDKPKEVSPIPHQLQGCRFVLVRDRDKRAFEKGWNTTQNYPHDSKRLAQHIAAEKNYGVMVSGGLCVLDCDNVLALYNDPFLDTLMQTFTVKTGRKGAAGAHFYFRCPELPAEKYPLVREDGTDVGDLRGSESKFYVVGPGSRHPSGNIYAVSADTEPITVPLADVEAFIGRYHKKEPAPKVMSFKMPKMSSGDGTIVDKLGLNVTDFLMPENPHPREQQIEGNNPHHDGQTGTNLILDPIANKWYCRHCTSGGGPLEALMVAEGIVDCSYFTNGNPGIQKEHWSAVFDALKKRGHSEKLAEMDRKRKGLAPIPKPVSTPTPPAGEPTKDDVRPPMPDIVVNGRDLKDVTEDTLRALYLHNNPPRMFIRAGGLVRIETDETGIPKISSMNKDAVRGRASCAAHYIRIMKDQTQTTVYPPIDVIYDIMALGEWPFPSISGVIEAPAIRPDGTIITQPGYDEATGVYYAPTKGFQDVPFSVPDEPTQEDIKAAKMTIAEIICDFPYVDDASRINSIATMITPVVRDLIKGNVPMALFNKPQPGTGASLLTDIIGIISTGRPAAMFTAPKNAEEWKKSITSALIDGRMVVTVDNIDGKLYSSVLASLLTSELWHDRILGRSEMVTLKHRMVWIGNGNNIQLGGDLPRRCYWVRLDAQMARPQERDGFRHSDIKEYVMLNRASILSAILTLARAWVVAGKPEPKDVPKLGGFEAWVSVMGGILSYAGYTGFLGNQREMYDANDVDTPQWEGFLDAWHNIWGERPVAVATVSARLEQDSDFVDALPDYLAEAYLDRQKSFVRVLGRALSSKKDTRYPSGLSVVMGNIERRAVQWKVVDVSKGVNK